MAGIRFVAAAAKIATSFAKLGLPPEAGMAWLLARLIGMAQWVFPPEQPLKEATAYAPPTQPEFCLPLGLDAQSSLR